MAYCRKPLTLTASSTTATAHCRPRITPVSTIDDYPTLSSNIKQ